MKVRTVQVKREYIRILLWHLKVVSINGKSKCHIRVAFSFGIFGLVNLCCLDEYLRKECQS